MRRDYYRGSQDSLSMKGRKLHVDFGLVEIFLRSYFTVFVGFWAFEQTVCCFYGFALIKNIFLN